MEVEKKLGDCHEMDRDYDSVSLNCMFKCLGVILLMSCACHCCLCEEHNQERAWHWIVQKINDRFFFPIFREASGSLASQEQQQVLPPALSKGQDYWPVRNQWPSLCIWSPGTVSPWQVCYLTVGFFFHLFLCMHTLIWPTWYFRS